jgi:hypothetical protein
MCDTGFSLWRKNAAYHEYGTAPWDFRCRRKSGHWMSARADRLIALTDMIA